MLAQEQALTDDVAVHARAMREFLDIASRGIVR